MRKRSHTREERRRRKRLVGVDAAVLIIVLSILLLWATSSTPVWGVSGPDSEPVPAHTESKFVPEMPAMVEPDTPVGAVTEEPEEPEEPDAPLWTREEAEVLAKMLWGRGPRH